MLNDSMRRTHFTARIRIYSAPSGGRSTQAFNGIKWDFEYRDAEPDEGLYVIWPTFMIDADNEWPKEVALATETELVARMHIASDELRQAVHQSRIKPGLAFYLREGSKRVGEGVVIDIRDLCL